MLYRETIAVCSEIHTKHTNTVCGQNVRLTSIGNVGIRQYASAAHDMPSKQRQGLVPGKCVYFDASIKHSKKIWSIWSQLMKPELRKK
jgi:hypothetical protein